MAHARSVLSDATDAAQVAHPCPHLVCCGSISWGSPEPGRLFPQLQKAHVCEVQLCLPQRVLVEKASCFCSSNHCKSQHDTILDGMRDDAWTVQGTHADRVLQLTLHRILDQAAGQTTPVLRSIRAACSAFAPRLCPHAGTFDILQDRILTSKRGIFTLDAPLERGGRDATSKIAWRLQACCMPTVVAAQGSVSRCRASVPYKDISELGSGSGLPGVKVSKAAVVRSIAQALAILLCEGHPQEVLAPRLNSRT